MGNITLVIYGFLALLIVFLVNYLLSKTKEQDSKNEAPEPSFQKNIYYFENIELDISIFNLPTPEVHNNYIINLDKLNLEHQKIIEQTKTEKFQLEKKEYLILDTSFQTKYYFKKHIEK